MCALMMVFVRYDQKVSISLGFIYGAVVKLEWSGDFLAYCFFWYVFVCSLLNSLLFILVRFVLKHKPSFSPPEVPCVKWIGGNWGKCLHLWTVTSCGVSRATQSRFLCQSSICRLIGFSFSMIIPDIHKLLSEKGSDSNQFCYYCLEIAKIVSKD